MSVNPPGQDAAPRRTSISFWLTPTVAGAAKVAADIPPIMAAEDFAFMLEARPGNMIFIGNGDTAACHHPAYDFNDAAISYGASYWSRLVETLMPAD